MKTAIKNLITEGRKNHNPGSRATTLEIHLKEPLKKERPASIGPRHWRSTEEVADYWDHIRRSMQPVPSAPEFLRLCDRHERRAWRYGEWAELNLAEYVKASLLANVN